jgi:hypothetical protein
MVERQLPPDRQFHWNRHPSAVVAFMQCHHRGGYARRDRPHLCAQRTRQNPNWGTVDDSDATKENPSLAAEQKRML